MTEVKKLAVLGGGVGSLSALLKLTEDPAERAKYDITLYQLGWRLGGKCASGRDVSHPPAARVYEHGLHIFAGFYFHAFGMLKGCYDELDGSGGVAAKKVYDAFRRKNDIVLYERVDGKQIPWPLDFLALPGLPHEPPAVPTIAQFVEEVIEAIFKHLIGGSGAPEVNLDKVSQATLDRHEGSLAERLGNAVVQAEHHVIEALFHADPGVAETHSDGQPYPASLHHARLLASHGNSEKSEEGLHLPSIIELLDKFAEEARAFFSFLGISDWLRRLLRGANLARAVLAGIEGDGVISKGFDHLDELELKEWLLKWGAWEETVNWAPVDAGYDYAFAYYEGDESKPSLGAGTGLRGFMRLLFAYKGALFWEMKGSMGEIVILPMYEVLRRRGVKFAFFHEVTDLGLSADGSRVETITMNRQAVPTAGGYDPLIPVPDTTRLAWPDRPNWGQLENGAAMEAEGIDLESPWSPNPYAASVSLRHGTDFDEVLLGISVAEVKRITPALSAHSAVWRDMVEGIQVSRTIALQMWTVHEIGPGGGGYKWPDRVNTRAEQPLSTWSDMTFLLEEENWPADAAPEGLYYWCGQVPGAQGAQHFNDPTVPQQALDAAREDCKAWLRENTPLMMPDIAQPDLPLGLDPDQLFVDNGSTGLVRFDWQYTRVNISPSELYVQSAPGTLKKRLRADESGFDNLYLAGDWTRNGLNAGAVEAAVMSGIQCANALMGRPGPIEGEQDLV